MTPLGPNVRLHRSETADDGTWGRFIVPFHDILFSIERPWRDNAPQVSCIPDGQYVLRRTLYHKGGYEVFEVCDVPGRSRILIHPANVDTDVEGCIGLGTRRGWLNVHGVDQRAVVQSQVAFHKFMDWMGAADSATLTVEWEVGLP